MKVRQGREEKWVGNVDEEVKTNNIKWEVIRKCDEEKTSTIVYL